MRGRRVERRFGWDCHGLPAELEAQRVLGLRTKADILELGIEKFNEACRESVLKYTDEWQDYVTRQARWVDFEHDYKTLNPSYMESVIWAFKTLHDKGLVYEGMRVLPYCWSDETPLSNHELRMDEEVYQQRQDPSVTVWVAAGDRRAADGVDDDAVDPAQQPGDGRGPGRRLRRRSSTTGRALRPGRGPAGRLRAGAGGGRGRPGRGPRSRAPTSSAGATPRSSTSSPTPPSGAPSRRTR